MNLISLILFGIIGHTINAGVYFGIAYSIAIILYCIRIIIQVLED